MTINIFVLKGDVNGEIVLWCVSFYVGYIINVAKRKRKTAVNQSSDKEIRQIFVILNLLPLNV